jgi:hypothetical protein
MKSNKGLYILLPLVAVVWGIIIYRIIKYVGQENTAIAELTLNEIKFEPEKFQNDTFSILANYRDPFLGSASIERANSHSPSRTTSSPASTSSLQPKAKTPTIIFKGIVKNKKSDKTIAVLKINDRTKMLAKGQTVDGIQLLNVSRDSIQVAYNGTKTIIHRK